MTQQSAVTNWTFTINNPHPYDEDVVKAWHPKVAKYIIFGREVGEKGTPHLQGYLQLKKRKRLTAMKKLHKEAHWEVAIGNAEQNRDYCSKDGDYTELGSVVCAGARSDIEAFKDAVKGGMISLRQLREEHSSVFARHPRFVREYVQDHLPEPPLPGHSLNEWQEKLNQLLIQEPDERTIIFVVDPKGNKGKTWFAKYYCSLHPENSQILEFGKKPDMAYALEPHIRHLFMNCSRQQVEFLNYSFLESVKDGMVFSSKYESQLKKLGNCHVVVLMNMQPDMHALSEDRYHILNI